MSSVAFNALLVVSQMVWLLCYVLVFGWIFFCSQPNRRIVNSSKITNVRFIKVHATGVGIFLIFLPFLGECIGAEIFFIFFRCMQRVGGSTSLWKRLELQVEG